MAVGSHARIFLGCINANYITLAPGCSGDEIGPAVLSESRESQSYLQVLDRELVWVP